MKKAVIIGKGPAGISAALYLVRAGIDTTIIGMDGGALAKAEKIENYYGFAEPVSGEKLLENGILAAKRLGVEVVTDEVINIGFEQNFVVKTTLSEYAADALILATGAARKSPNIKGIAEFEGKGVSYCATCDAFFYKGKDVVVLGSGKYALEEALELSHVANKVYIASNGETFSIEIPENIIQTQKKIQEIKGSNTVETIAFDDGTEIGVSGLFVALGIAGSSDFARKLGAEVLNGKIVVDQGMATAVPGLYAAGDTVGGLLQISKAVSDGAVAGTEAIKYLRSL